MNAIFRKILMSGIVLATVTLSGAVLGAADPQSLMSQVQQGKLNRQTAAAKLAECGNSAVPALRNALAKSYSEKGYVLTAKEVAVDALARIGTDESLAAFETALTDKQLEVRKRVYLNASVLHANGKMSDSAYERILAACVLDEDVQTQVNGIGSLRRQCGSKAIEPTLDCLDKELKKPIAARGFQRPPAEFPLYLDPHEYVVEKCFDSIKEMNASIIPALTKRWNASSGETRYCLAILLCRFPDGMRDVDGLRAAVRSSTSPTVRYKAIEALASIGAREAEPEIRAALDDPYNRPAGRQAKGKVVFVIKEYAKLALAKLGLNDK